MIRKLLTNVSSTPILALNSSCNPRALILFTRCLADAANPLRLKVSSSMNTAAFAPGEPHEHMQITAQNNQLPGSTCCTGNEHRNIHGNRYVCDYRCVRDLKHGQDQEDNPERGTHHVFHESTSISGAKTSGCYITKSIDWE